MKVSICIPTYNQSQYIAQAVRSAYNQSLKPAEIIVSDDCSTDNTSAILDKLQAEIPVLRVVYRKVNIGMVRNTDACLREGCGDFIVGLDSDDYLSYAYVEKLAHSLNQYPNACYAHSNIQEVDKDGNFKKLRILYQNPGFQNGNQALHAARKGYRVAANIIMFRKEHLIKLNYFTNRPEYVKDYHFSAAAAALGLGNVFVDETLAFYRVWMDTGKARLQRKLDEIKGLYSVFDDILMPSYKERGWSLSKLKKNRTNFASTQADCLSWNVYTEKEKNELAAALSKLSSAPRAKLVAWMYKNGHGKYVEMYSNVMSKLRSELKEILVSRKLRFNQKF